jgi:dolichyl-phosphate beta-glucosyltransferase
VLSGLFVRWFTKPIWESLQHIPATDYCHFFLDPNTGSQRHAFPSLVTDAAAVKLSFIVPAFDEAKRIGAMLNETLEYLDERQQREKHLTWEIIIVDDGSKDRTTEVGLEYVKKYGSDRIRVLTLKQNQGKGGAVQQGMLAARGQYLLMVDADGATRISDLEKLEEKLRSIEIDGMGIAVGSRKHLEADAIATRKCHRNILMYGFHFAVALLCVRGIKDTQCGFKLFTRKAAQHLFINQKLRRWAFDVELLFLARQLNIPMVEVSVNWTEIAGSKLDPFNASITMARDLVVIRLSYMLRIWRIRTPRSVAKQL